VAVALLTKQRGFTLLELLVVISIIGIGTAGVALAMRDGNQAQLEREAQRLTALLESARAQSRSSGAPVQWVGSTKGFWFEGVAPGSLPDNWLAPTTTVTKPQRVGLGPEPLIGKQSITLITSTAPGRSITVSTDGLRPFKVQTDDAATP
jgi:general secretion pathway protein H